ncbi:cupin domain-containing protein [Halobacterium salinarum]|nr:cupin domain-containing protein [Halobacterium salinarum]MCF2238661.1 cupin domain-containing protein [Halobacterium salinarum]MCF2240305.1 cupin domain-containing protein [Halobacterium salinarum]
MKWRHEPRRNMAHKDVSVDDVDSALSADADADLYFMKDALNTDEVAISVYHMEPGATGMEHDHANDGQEEVYYVADGGVDVVFDDETVSLDAGDAIRVDATDDRQLHNGDHHSELVLVGAPR